MLSTKAQYTRAYSDCNVLFRVSYFITTALPYIPIVPKRSEENR